MFATEAASASVLTVTSLPQQLTKWVSRMVCCSLFQGHKGKLQLLTGLTDAFPSSEAFDAIAAALSDPKEKKDAVKQGNAIFAFNLKNAQGQEKAWHLDLKESGNVGEGLAPSGKKADGEHD